MKQKLYIWKIVSLILVVSGCTAIPMSNTEINTKVRAIVLGKNIDNLYSMWGKPTRVEQLPSANGKIYVWQNSDYQSIVTADKLGLVTDYYANGNYSLK
ncbi:hypothetical protein [Leptothrix ochracea]|uniref:hypothetical protein n=1 Tax=Leptothrix ochracea TaxID=735331 RepID=UPI0034E2EACE